MHVWQTQETDSKSIPGHTQIAPCTLTRPVERPSHRHCPPPRPPQECPRPPHCPWRSRTPARWTRPRPPGSPLPWRLPLSLGRPASAGRFIDIAMLQDETIEMEHLEIGENVGDGEHAGGHWSLCYWSLVVSFCWGSSDWNIGGARRWMLGPGTRA